MRNWFKKWQDNRIRAIAVRQARELPRKIVYFARGRNIKLPSNLAIRYTSLYDRVRQTKSAFELHITLVDSGEILVFKEGNEQNYTLEDLVLLVEFCKQNRVMETIQQRIEEEAAAEKSRREEFKQRFAEETLAKKRSIMQAERKLVDLLVNDHALPIPSSPMSQDTTRLPIVATTELPMVATTELPISAKLPTGRAVTL